jgi:hypothetical protein
MTPSLRDRARNSLSLTMMSETQERADFKMKQEQQEGIRESKATDRGGGRGKQGKRIIYIDTRLEKKHLVA